MLVSNAGKFGAAVALATLTATGILLLGDEEKEPTRVEKHFDGGVPKDAKCLTATVLASPAALEKEGLKGERPRYAVLTVCGDEPRLPDGVRALDVTTTRAAYASGPAYKLVLQGEAEFPCACSTGADCEMRAPDGGWMPAWTGNTLSAGQWRGDGCFRKACVEGLGWASSWPPECPE